MALGVDECAGLIASQLANPRIRHTLVVMEWHHYRFISTWHLDAQPADVYRVLRDSGDYPRWWRALRSVLLPPRRPGLELG